MIPQLGPGRLCLRCIPINRKYLTAHSFKSQAGTQVQSDNEEYSESPQYPAIYDPSFESRKERQRLMWQDEIRRARTVEEKLIKINMPKYYGYKVVQMNHLRLPYNCLPAIQHYTRTVFEPMSIDHESEDNEKIKSLVDSVKGNIVDVLELALDYCSQTCRNLNVLDTVEREELFSQTIVEQVNRVLINSLSSHYTHLHDLEVDFNPRHEAFWAVGGIEAPKNVVKSKEGREWQKETATASVDRFMQYKSKPMLALRHTLQVVPWKTEKEYTDVELAKTVPCFGYDPRTLGFTTGYQHGTNIPGHWPGNMAGFGYLSYQPRIFTHLRQHINDAKDYSEAIHGHAMQSSYAWLLALANYNGFNTYSELTYPMNTQTIITNGQFWSFYDYQLNTLLMNGRHFNENPRVNFCRGTEELKLYQDIDEKGKLIGFNEQVLYHLIRHYTNVPNVEIAQDELAPFLDTQYKYVADYPDEEKRTFLEKIFKHMCSNRPRHLELPETYMWEKIYKIDNKTRPMEARRRFFEVFVNPWKRTMDQHDKEYIPKAIRPEGPKSKKKRKLTFYP